MTAEASRTGSPFTPLRLASLLGALALGCAVAVGAARFAAADAAQVFARIGAMTERLMPLTSAFWDSAAALTCGGALMAGWVMPTAASRQRSRPWIERSRERVMLIVAAVSAVWTLLSVTQLLLSYALASGQGLFSENFGSDIGIFITSDLGVWGLWGIAFAGASSACAWAGSSVALARLTALGALGALFAKAMTGHSAGTASHETATSSMLFHLLAFAAWVGPLALFLVLDRVPAEAGVGRDDAVKAETAADRANSAGDDTAVADRADAARVVRRYSALALVAWVFLGVSGAVSLLSRVRSLADLTGHPYGQLGLAKIVLLLLLAGFGARQRAALARHAAPGRLFAALASLELLLMGIALGLGAAMSSSPPPGEAVPPPATPFGIMTGYALPPAPFTLEALAQWAPDIFGLGIAALVFAWAYGVRRDKNSRARASSARLISRPHAVAAAASYALLASSPLYTYAKALTSTHLVLSALLIAIPGALLGWSMRGPACRWAEAHRGSRRPTVLAAAGAASAAPGVVLAAGYLPFGFLHGILESHAAHLAFAAACVVAGALWILGWSIAWRAGDSPAAPGLIAAVPAGLGSFAAVSAALGSLAAAAALAPIALGSRLLAPDWFGATGRSWRANALVDQHEGALLAAAILAAACIVLSVASRKPSAPYGGEQGDPRDR